jgi:osmotically-inducible protein OsmY
LTGVNLIMKADMQLTKDVVEKLEAALGAEASGIGVSVKDGAVMLSGTAPTCTEKYAAERAVLGVPGVKAVAEGVQVREAHQHGDEETAEAVARALQQDPNVPAGVQATVEGGWVTLQGEVFSTGQREAALDAVRNRAGLERIYNLITVKPHE